ncbi:SulP family inorganic anion transporter [Fontimonas thermophila]|uniref:SulP family inorganic anion transporter n=1 Tax=Fontimonas thermophila TaxID=1076937 RepID=UPI00190E9B79|nr:sulfate permease [Fontimonas thermophila]
MSDLRHGNAAQWLQDGLAGTITAILLVPQALAYALLAGMPPEVGLYASVLPIIVYACLGTSRTLAVGPVAVAAVMVSSALIPFAQGDPQRYLTGALILSCLSGGTLLMMGILRLGWLTNFISHPVLSGFTSGAAIFIIATQLSALSGIPVPREAGFIAIFTELARHADKLNPATLAFGLTSLVLLVLSRDPLKRWLTARGVGSGQAAILSRVAPLIVVAITTMASSITGAHDRYGVDVVGRIPQGLPGVSLAFLQASGWLALLPSAALIALIGYVESISVAKALAFRRGEKVDPDQELVALGATNIAAACAGAMPVAGGFARSMVNFDAGARTQLAAVVTALWVALSAFLFTGLLADLPKSVLAAIIVVAVWQLIDLRALLHTWSYDKGDAMAQGLTIVGVLLLGIEHGLLAGASLSLLLFLYRTSRPHIAVVGRLGDTEHYRNVLRHPVQTWRGLLLVRIDENLYFANAPRVESELHRLIVEHQPLGDVVLIMSGVAYVDTSGLDVLDTLERELAAQGIRLHLAEVKGPVMDRLMHTELIRRIGAHRIHLSAHQAVCAIRGNAEPERSP